MNETPAIRVRDLRVTVHSPTDGALPIVRGVSFDVRAGRVLGVVGESGCGKSTVADALLRLNPPEAELSGQIVFKGRDLLKLSEREMRQLRGARISLVSQDPLGALNPLHRVGNQIREVLIIHRKTDRATARAGGARVIRQCELPDPEVTFRKYPHELSGGMQQRIAIAIAMAGEPEVIVADEPTTSLDNSVQRQILDLLRSLCLERGVALVLITHDFGVVRDVADDMIVLYAGVVLEMGATAEVLARPLHQYTRALLTVQPQVVDGYRAVADSHPRGSTSSRGCSTRLRFFAPLQIRIHGHAREPCAEPDVEHLELHWHRCRHPGDEPRTGTDESIGVGG